MQSLEQRHGTIFIARLIGFIDVGHVHRTSLRGFAGQSGLGRSVPSSAIMNGQITSFNHERNFVGIGCVCEEHRKLSEEHHKDTLCMGARQDAYTPFPADSHPSTNRHSA